MKLTGYEQEKLREILRRHGAAAPCLLACQLFRPERNSARVSGWVLKTPPREVVVV
ncbi:hypothetical protein FNBNMHLP_04163 [Aeromonas jandaei]